MSNRHLNNDLRQHYRPAAIQRMPGWLVRVWAWL